MHQYLIKIIKPAYIVNAKSRNKMQLLALAHKQLSDGDIFYYESKKYIAWSVIKNIVYARPLHG